MLFYDKQFPDGWRIAIWHVTETLDELLEMLPDDETVRLQANVRFKSESRILEWTAVRVLLYDMLDRQVEILYHDDGAPYLPQYEKLDISISHTKGYVAIGLSEKGDIGIDIEKVDNKVVRVKERFVREDENADSLNKLLLHWSAKETAFKMMRRNKVDFVKHLKIKPFDDSEEGVFNLQELKTDNKEIFDIHYKIFPDFVLTYSISLTD